MNNQTDYADVTTSQMIAGLLSIAAILGEDLMKEVVVVGGLVPRLRSIGGAPPLATSAHIGTNDIDLAIELSVFEDKRYASIAKRLKDAGAQPRTNPGVDGEENIKHAQWRFEPTEGVGVDIDFVIAQPDTTARRPGSVKHFGGGLGAFVMDAAVFASHSPVDVEVKGPKLDGALTTRIIRVASWAGFVVMKALAIANREKNKDSYDLCWVLEHVGPDVVATEMRALPDTAGVKTRALKILDEKFQSADHEGPRYVVAFEGGADRVDANRAQDIVGLVKTFLQRARDENPTPSVESA